MSRSAERERAERLEWEQPGHEINSLERSEKAVAREQIDEQISGRRGAEKAVYEQGRGELEKALEEGKGERHRIIGGNMTGRNARELAREFGAFREQRRQAGASCQLERRAG